MGSDYIASCLHNLAHSFFSDMNYVDNQGFVYHLLAQEMKRMGTDALILDLDKQIWSAPQPIPAFLRKALEQINQKSTSMGVHSVQFGVTLLSKKSYGKEIAVKVLAQGNDGTAYDLPVTLQK